MVVMVGMVACMVVVVGLVPYGVDDVVVEKRCGTVLGHMVLEQQASSQLVD